MKKKLLSSLSILIVVFVCLSTKAHSGQILVVDSFKELRSHGQGVPRDTSSVLPLSALHSLPDGGSIGVYEEVKAGQIDLVASVFSSSGETKTLPVSIASNVLLQDVGIVVQKEKVVVVTRTFSNRFQFYYLEVSQNKVRVQRVINVKPFQWGENLSFYPKFGVDVVQGKIWICLADAVDSTMSNSNSLPLPPTPAQSQVRLHWSFIAGDKLWKVGSYTLKSKPKIGTPVSMCWLPDQRLITTFGRQILSYRISEKQVSEIKPSFLSEGTSWFSIAAHGKNQILVISTDVKKDSSLLLIDIGSGKRITSVTLPQDVPVEHQTTNLSQSDGKYLLSYLPYSSRLVPNTGPHGASIPYYTYRGVKLTEVFIK